MNIFMKIVHLRASKLNKVANVEMVTGSGRYSHSVSCRRMCAHEAQACCFLRAQSSLSWSRNFPLWTEV